jgi:hypothetical protein
MRTKRLREGLEVEDLRERAYHMNLEEGTQPKIESGSAERRKKSILRARQDEIQIQKTGFASIRRLQCQLALEASYVRVRSNRVVQLSFLLLRVSDEDD